MTDTPPETTEQIRRWLADQIELFGGVAPRYARYAEVLEAILRTAARQIAPLAIIQARPKSVGSFAGKALRKRHKYREPARQLTDLTGARVIARTRSEVDAFCEFVKAHFELDWPNSLDTSQRLGAGEFGYRSVHYVVSCRPGAFPTRDVPIELPPEILPDTVHAMKAEIQLRTTVEHAYADFAHDLSYKGAFAIPFRWQRELASAAAALEAADETFDRIERRLSHYASSYGAYLDEEEIEREMVLLGIVLEHDPDNVQLAARLAKLAITVGAWERAIETLSPHVPGDESMAPPALLRDLGIALCKANRAQPACDEYRRGQRLLELAVEIGPPDVDALASLAGTWKGRDEGKVRELYRRAFEADPADPYGLENHLEGELERDPALLATARPLIHRAVERCRAHIAVGINLPWAYFSLGKFHLLLGEPYESLDAYARAIRLSSTAFMIETALASIERLEHLAVELEGSGWIRRLLALALAGRFPSPEAAARVAALATVGAAPLAPPVVIVAGGTDPRLQERMQAFRGLLLEAFAGFEGTIISGGTTEGVSGLVGDVAEAYPGRIRTVSYLPELVPAGATVERDRRRYHDLRNTGGHGFSPLEPLQNWVDLFASGVDPRQVLVVGINGGRIAAAEFRIALALRARVGILEHSGREAERLAADDRWAGSEGLLSLPQDAQVVRAFLASSGKRSDLDESSCEAIARRIHEEYRSQRAASSQAVDPALAGWDELPETLRRSNFEQAREIFAKLAAVGCEVVPLAEAPEPAVELAPDELERMARMEHGRFTVERLRDGWTRGEQRDVARKISPYLVAWDDLPDSIRQIDRDTVGRIPDYLAAVGLAIRRQAPPGKDGPA